LGACQKHSGPIAAITLGRLDILDQLVTVVQRDAVMWTQPIKLMAQYYAILIITKVASRKNADLRDALVISAAKEFDRTLEESERRTT